MKINREYMQNLTFNNSRFYLIEGYEHFLPFWTIKAGDSGGGKVDCLHSKRPYWSHIYIPFWGFIS